MPPPDPSKHAPMLGDLVWDYNRATPEAMAEGRQPNGFIYQMRKDEIGELIINVKFHDKKFTMRHTYVDYNYAAVFRGRYTNTLRGWVLNEPFDTDETDYSKDISE